LISFHAFDRETYPRRGVDTLKALMARYDVDLPIIRSSYVPEKREEGSKRPGTTDPVAIAPHLVGALRDGLEASGLWEIQNRNGEDDVRYWFDGDETTPTVRLWRMLALRLGLGQGFSTMVHVEGTSYTEALAALNPAGEPVGLVVAEEGGGAFEVEATGLPVEGAVAIHRFGLKGPLASTPLEGNIKEGQLSFRLPTPERGVYAFHVIPEAR
jgi:hypothetical protein